MGSPLGKAHLWGRRLKSGGDTKSFKRGVGSKEIGGREERGNPDTGGTILTGRPAEESIIRRGKCFASADPNVGKLKEHQLFGKVPGRKASRMKREAEQIEGRSGKKSREKTESWYVLTMRPLDLPASIYNEKERGGARIKDKL